jgi:hypothetical protein
MAFTSEPWGIIPQPNEEWLGAMGAQRELDTFITISGQKIMWPSSNSGDFKVRDYSQEDFIRLKGVARARCMKYIGLRPIF